MLTAFWNPARFPGLSSAAAATVILTTIVSICLGVCNIDTKAKHVFGALHELQLCVWGFRVCNTRKEREFDELLHVRDMYQTMFTNDLDQ